MTQEKYDMIKKLSTLYTAERKKQMEQLEDDMSKFLYDVLGFYMDYRWKRILKEEKLLEKRMKEERNTTDNKEKRFLIKVF